MYFKNPLCLLMILSASAAFAAGNKATALAATVPCAFTNETGEVLLYRKTVPPPSAKPAPLVLFLHGAGERGTDNQIQVVHGVGPIIDWFARHGAPVCLLAPQCEPGRRWVETDWNLPAHDFQPIPSKMMRLALQLLEKTIREENVDLSRVYITGLSMGGYGTWDAICRRPDLFAGAMPICGGGDPHQAANIADIPIIAVHGDADSVVPTSRTRDMVATLRSINAPIRHIEYPGCGHNSWSAAYGDDALLGWLFSKRRKNALPRAPWLVRRADEPASWEVAAENLTPAAYLERLRQTGIQLRLACPTARIICRRDLVGDSFAKALDAFGEGEEYEYRTVPSLPVLTGRMDGPLLCAGYGRAYLLGADGAELAAWNGCGNIHRVIKTTSHIWWSNGRVWRVPIAGGTPELVYKADSEGGGGVLGFTVEPDGSVVMAVNSTCEIIELAPPPAFPARAAFRVRTRFKVDARDAKGNAPGAHGALRMIRKTAAGTYLVCCSSAAKVKEYDKTGKLLWEQDAPPFAFDCLRRENGNTIVSHLDGVTEFTQDHKPAWKISCADFPELKLAFLCGLQERRNGNLVIGTWANGSPSREKTTAFEITRDKKIIWTHRSADANMMTAFRVD